MKIIKRVLAKGKWSISIVATIFAVIQFLDYFKVYNFSNIGIKGLVMLVILAVIIIIVSIIAESINKTSDAQNKINEINEKITDRIGVLKSSQKPDREMVDSVHYICMMERMDILDYATSDYLSYRMINGKNVSKKISAFLKYKESTDSKTAAKELLIKAYDLKTGKELKIEFENNEQKVYVHNFKIMFTRPLRPNEEFSIIYFMKIPNELAQLDDNEEMMSISLNRFEKKIDILKFGVFLNFEPKHVETFMRKGDGTAQLLNCELIIDKTNEIQIAEDFNKLISETDGTQIINEFKKCIENIKINSKIKIEINNPDKETFVIYYRK